MDDATTLVALRYHQMLDEHNHMEVVHTIRIGTAPLYSTLNESSLSLVIESLHSLWRAALDSLSLNSTQLWYSYSRE